MATKNLGLPVLDGGDYISVDPFNQAFSEIDKLGTDYIVESGKSGEWWYRKWKSGRAECGIDNKVMPKVAMIGWGPLNTLFCTPQQPIGTYPIQFKSKPSCIINFVEDKAYGSGRGCFLINYGNGTATAGPSVAMVDPTKKDAQLVLSVFVAGWYK